MNISEHKILKFIAWSFAVIGFAIIVIFLCAPPFNDWSGQLDSKLFGEYGDFIGGFVGALFSLAGFFLLYLTLRAQQETTKKQDEELKAQKKAFEQESFETTFFNLLNVQQNITNDLKADLWKLNGIIKKRYQISGREFFRVAVLERFWINSSLSTSEYQGIYNESENEEWVEEFEQLSGSESINAYPFDEIGDKEIKMLRRRKIQLINLNYGITKDRWEVGKHTTGIDRVNFVYELFFKKYHYVVGHYFRNLYHIVKFVRQFEVIQRRKNCDSLEDERIIKRCYQYARFIQAQMSSDELAMLHDNSLSFPKMLKLVKKYNLVDNCAVEVLIDKTNYIE